MPNSLEDMIHSGLTIVSNRQPYRHEYVDDGIEVDRPCGGVVAGLDAVAKELGGTWVAWGDGEADAVVADESGRVPVPPGEPRYTLDRVWLDDADVTGYYEGYSNRVLWPLSHSATGAISYRPEYWDRYRDVNRQFAREVVDAATPEEIVWFQDYHLALAPGYVREAHDGILTHFWHIPWPPADIFRICPQRQELLEGLLANDVIGFHLEEYAAHFLASVDRFVPSARVDHEARRVSFDGRTIRIESFPLGIDVDAVEERTAADIRPDRFLPEGVKGQIALGVDRVDYTKGIPKRLDALEYLWAHQPEWRQRFTYVQKEMLSREGIPEYRDLQERIEQRTTSINARFGTEDWDPIVRLEGFLPEEELYALYRTADVMLVSALRDGMNLVAQEYVGAQLERDGVLVLSEFAGAHRYLGEHAVTINPYDTAGHAEAIARAVSMNAMERNRRMRALHNAVKDLDIDHWIQDNLRAAGERRVGRAPAGRAGE